MDAKQFVKTSNLLSGKSAREMSLDCKTFTIADVDSIEFRDGAKIVLSLEETEKLLPLNNARTKVLIEAFGWETDYWKGKKFVMLVIEREVKGEMKDSMVVKPVNEKEGEVKLPSLKI